MTQPRRGSMTVNGVGERDRQPRLRRRSGSRERGSRSKKGAQPIDHSRICDDLKAFVLSENTSKSAVQDFLRDSTRAEAFSEAKKANSGRMGRGRTGNIFHHLVRGISTEWSDQDLCRVLQWLFDDNNRMTNDEKRSNRTALHGAFSNLLREELDRGETAMHMALSRANEQPTFVKVMLTVLNPVPGIVAEVLCMPLKSQSMMKGRNCLHIAIANGSEYTKAIFDHMKAYMEKLGPDLCHPLRLQEPEEDNTPLHLAVEVAPLEESLTSLVGRIAGERESEPDEDMRQSLDLIEQLVKSYPDALEVTNKHKRTPYQQRIWQLREDSLVKEAILVFRKARSKAKETPPMPSKDTQADEDEVPEHVKMIRRVIETYRRSRGVEVQPRKKGSAHDIAEETISRILDEEARDVVESIGGSEIDTSKCTDQDSKEFRQIVIGDPVAEFIRNYCIREMDREKVMRCLYAQGEELAIDFNLAGISRKSISEDYLGSFETHLRFEATLNQVVLPKLAFVPKRPKSHRDSRLPAKYKGRVDFANIFDWLRRQQVRKICKITVHDDESPHHTDKAIVECLNGFRVEEWDWRRIDLSSEVIWNASRDVRDISLYCSGNQAVLKGWSSKGGFADPEKFPKLEKITVYLREGQEDTATLSKYGRTFEHDFNRTFAKTSKHKPRKKVEVDYKIDSYPYGMIMSGNRDTSDENGHARITFLKNFATFFRNNPPDDGSRPSIKIAILDNGLDSSMDILKNGYTVIERGCAFYSDTTGNRGEYYVPSGDHGARVASLICSICPNTKLYIAKLGYESTQDGRMQINVIAATKAVEWAVQCSVDIINMSWTIDHNMTENELTPLRNAIDNARSRGIVMFCSTNDQGGGSKICYPASYDSTIAIGSLSSVDRPSLLVQTDQVQFMLPGERLLVHNNDGSATVDTGSSLATAVATGMGGLLMYYTLFVGLGETPSMRIESSGPPEDNTKPLNWDNNLMKRVLRNISFEISTKEKKLTRPEHIHELLQKKMCRKKHQILHPEQDIDASMMEALKDIFLTHLSAESSYAG